MGYAKFWQRRRPAQTSDGGGPIPAVRASASVARSVDALGTISDRQGASSLIALGRGGGMWVSPRSCESEPVKRPRGIARAACANSQLAAQALAHRQHQDAEPVEDDDAREDRAEDAERVRVELRAEQSRRRRKHAERERQAEGRVGRKGQSAPLRPCRVVTMDRESTHAHQPMLKGTPCSCHAVRMMVETAMAAQNAPKPQTTRASLRAGGRAWRVRTAHCQRMEIGSCQGRTASTPRRRRG